MVLATANYFLKWLSRLIPIKRSDALTATLGNDSGSKESVNHTWKEYALDYNISDYVQTNRYPFL